MGLLERLENPEPGDIGAWVTLPDGRAGQVWAKFIGCGSDPKNAVWAVDGTEYVLVRIADLKLTTEATESEAGLW